MVLSELAEKYVEYTILRPPSIRHYVWVMKTLIIAVGDIEINDLTTEEIIKYRNIILARAKPITFNNYRQHIVVMINFAIANGWIKVNPFAKIKPIRTPKKPKKTVEISLIERVLVLLETASSLSESSPHCQFQPQWFWRVVVLTFYSTGMRLRQLVELRWKDINHELGQITLRVEGSKTAREWTIPMPALIRDEMLELWCKTKELSGGKNISNQQVFNLPLFSKFKKRFVGNEMGEGNVQAFFKRVSRVLGERISSHRLRHTTATTLVKKYNDLKSIQMLLGHANIRTTLEYVEEDVESMRNMVDGLTLTTCRSKAIVRKGV